MVDYALALGLAGRVDEQGWWLAQASSAAGERDADLDVRLAGVDAQWHGMRGEPDPVLAFEREVFSRLTPGTDFVLDQFPILSSRAHLYNGDPLSCMAMCDRSFLAAPTQPPAWRYWGSGRRPSSTSVSHHRRESPRALRSKQHKHEASNTTLASLTLS